MMLLERGVGLDGRRGKYVLDLGELDAEAAISAWGMVNEQVVKNSEGQE